MTRTTGHDDVAVRGLTRCNLGIAKLLSSLFRLSEHSATSDTVGKALPCRVS